MYEEAKCQFGEVTRLPESSAYRVYFIAKAYEKLEDFDYAKKYYIKSIQLKVLLHQLYTTAKYGECAND